MLVFRFLTLSLLAAGVILLATLRPTRIVVVQPTTAPPVSPPIVHPWHRGSPVTAVDVATGPSSVTVVDIAAGVSPWDLAPMIYLRPGERITAVNDRSTEDRPPIERMEELPPRSGSYLDLTVTSETAERRVLLLMH